MNNKKIIPEDASGQSYPPQKPRIIGIGGGHYYDSKTFTSGYRITTHYSDGSKEFHDIPHPPKIKSTLRGGANSGRGERPPTGGRLG